MSHSRSANMFLLFGYLLFALQCATGVLGSGPVFVNPQQEPAPAAAPTQANYVTQTVYGFLDFTTTIGNTVMVFSPQSVAPAPPPQAAAPASNTVIDTKPIKTTSQQAFFLQPSKTVQKQEQNKPASTSVVQPLAPQILSSKVSVAEPKSKINVIESVLHVVNSPVLPSKVDVVTQQAIIPVPKIMTKVEVIGGTPSLQNPQILSSKVDVFQVQANAPTPPNFIVSSVVEVKTDEEPALIGNNIGEPEYDFLSRQPSEVVEETYKVINLKPSAKFHLKPRPPHPGHSKAHQQSSGSQQKRPDAHPTGLVTKLGGTVVKDGATTVHETSVIGTYISGKYAQVLQSTSHIINHNKPKINPSPPLRILKTAAATLNGKPQHKHHHLEPTPAGSLQEETVLSVENLFNSVGNGNNLIKSTRRPTGPGGRSTDFKPRFRNRKQEENEEDESEQEVIPQQQPSHGGHKKSATRPRPSSTLRPFKHNKFGRTTTELATVSVFSEPSTTTASSNRRYQTSRRSSKTRPAANPQADTGFSSRRGYKPRVQSTAAESPASQASTSLYKFKLNRAPGRWQYKTTPKPRVTIRRTGDDEESSGTTPSGIHDGSSPYYNDVATPNPSKQPNERSDDLDLNPLGSETSNANIDNDEIADSNKIDHAFPLETIKVEISTPADFKNVYYELATIKSPYTFQVGSVKNTRYITVTSTIERNLEPEHTIMATATEPLTENILATSQNYDKDNNLDSGIATLPALFLASDMATPPLETLTETFSTTQDMLKTHILPIVHGANETMSYTLVQTYHITRLVTATKTLPPMEAYHFVPSKTLKDFNSHLDEAGSELHLELEFGDDNDQDENSPRRVFPPDLNLANVGSEFDLSDVDKNRILEGHLRSKKAHTSANAQVNSIDQQLFQQQQLQQHQQQQQQQTPALSPEQLQQLAILRLLNPAAAAQQQVITTSRPVVKLETVYESHIVSLFNGVSTTLSTISRPVGTVTKTDYEYGTSTISGLPGLPPALPQGLPAINPLFPQPPAAQFSVTSTPVVTQTIVTQTESKVLKLTFGAKTAYTTITSTRVVPTVLTTFVTASVPVVQQTAAFPGYFPGAFPAFPYVG